MNNWAAKMNRGRVDARLVDRFAVGLLWLVALGILGLLVAILAYLLWDGLPHLSLSFLTSRPKELEAGGGVAPEIFNSLYILTLSMLLSLPVGIGAGIYLAEYAHPGRLTDLIRLSVEALASVPSIVLGLFGMIVFVNMAGWGFSILGGAATLALLNLPVLVRVTEETFRSIPMSYREASLALGATMSQTIARAVLPSALPGLVSAIILVAGRALGETAILIFTAGTSVSRQLFDLYPFAAGETLAVHLWYVRSEALVPDAAEIASASAALLILMVLVVTFSVRLPVWWFNRRQAGSRRRQQ